MKILYSESSLKLRENVIFSSFYISFLQPVTKYFESLLPYKIVSLHHKRKPSKKELHYFH